MLRRMSTWLVVPAILASVLLAGCEGENRVESPPLLQLQPVSEIPGIIAHVSGKRLEFDVCIVVLPASGTAPAKRVTCDYPGQSQMVWLDESRLGLLEYAGWGRDWIENGVIRHEPEQSVKALDIATGTITETSVSGYIQGWGSETVLDLDVPSRSISVRGEVARVDDTGTLFIDSREVTRFEGVKDRLHVGLWSPDGEWLLLIFEADESDELWIVRRDGEVMRTLSTASVADVSWMIPGVGITPRFISSTRSAPVP